MSTLRSLGLDSVRSCLRRGLHPIEEEPELASGLRPAAVLATIFPRGDELWLPLIVRADAPDAHGGQMALPGGAYEVSDGSLMTTALRESFEEVRLDPAGVDVIGWAEQVIVPVSGYEVVPYVACASVEPQLEPHAPEVASIICMPLRQLLDPSAARQHPNPPGSRHATYYEFDVDGNRLWGATARMLVHVRDALIQAEADDE
jgi:ADP-ribose pyrophosphatase YjhB (NUDIX family)